MTFNRSSIVLASIMMAMICLSLIAYAGGLFGYSPVVWG